MSGQEQMDKSVGIPDELKPLFVCPRCHGTLSWREAGAHCQPCGLEFPLKDGLLDFVSALQDEPRGADAS